jgi:type I restriction-modification system DNA methylase subunit
LTIPAKLHELVERFEREHAAYRSGEYNEAQVRIEFINPLFDELLGWDIENRRGRPVAYRDVVYEDRVKIGSHTKAPDYGFYIDGVRKFFLEAKKPSVDIQGDVNPAVQLRRYAWSAKLPLSILTDFEELAVYDCRFKPNKDDRPSAARLDLFTYVQYVERWEEIAGLFSREAVLGGSLEKCAEENRRRRGTETVDAAFLREIEGWRDTLARNLALSNDLNVRQLNFAVQMTIDRIIFLRMAEDRGIEEYGRLLALVNGNGVYGRLRELFREADDRYNSGLFHFRDERDREEEPDRLTPSLKIDDKVLKRIIRGLYYPQSPYEFSVLPVDVLGQVYEQFLGKVIRLTGSGHRAKVEEKPEVRKAGGVYYTPPYIVDYIVEKTVGKLLEGKRPGPRGGASKLKIVDPACGSGSFLIGAYQYLLDWHRDRYVEDGPEKHRKELYQGHGGQWHLTIDEKKRILLNNIHGVDIDPQAVEVTKLSLLLKVLEGESEASLATQLRMFQERALPDLDDNIKCGNSLIGPDFYDDEQMMLLDEEEHYRINVFDWETEFPQVFEGDSPGFDAVIGNPPYIRIQALNEFAPVEVEHYRNAYRTARRGNYDVYVVFVERGLELLNKNGRLGYILPHKFFNTNYGAPLRELISKGKHLSEIVHFGDEQIFAGSTTYTSLMFLGKSENDEFTFAKVDDLTAWRTTSEVQESRVSATSVTSKVWNFFVGSGAPLATRLIATFPSLEQVAAVYVGVQTSADSVYILVSESKGDDKVVAYSESLGRTVELEKALLLPIVSGTDVQRYTPLPSRQWIIFPYNIVDTSATLMPWSTIVERAPSVAAYLKENERTLRSRERGRFNDEQWYRFGRNQNIGIQTRQKLCVPRLVDHLKTTVDTDGSHCLDNVDVNGLRWREDQSSTRLLYLAGIINSRLCRWLFPQLSAPFRGGFWSANRQFLGQLPVRTIDFSDPEDVARHDRMVGLVEWMLELHERLAEAKIERERTVIGAQISATDRQIDRFVYELYGLTDDEVRIVEEATTR